MFFVPFCTNTENKSANQCHATWYTSSKTDKKSYTKSWRRNISDVSERPSNARCNDIKNKNNNGSNKNIYIIINIECNPWKFLGFSDDVTIFHDDCFDFLCIWLNFCITYFDDSLFFICFDFWYVLYFFDWFFENEFTRTTMHPRDGNCNFFHIVYFLEGNVL